MDSVGRSALRFVKREPVLTAAALLALISCIFVPPDRLYLEYIDLRTLALLYCLMTVVAGFRQAGLFDWLAHLLCSRASDTRTLRLLLVLLCFFSSMLITNDVALLTFVPFTIIVLKVCHQEKDMILVVVLQTIAANLGSILTPVGNPQNLYLYAHYQFSFGRFLLTMLPVWLLSLGMLAACCFLSGHTALTISLGHDPTMNRRQLILWSILFMLCLLVVIRILPWPAMLAIVIAAGLLFDPKSLKRADLLLLLTFIAFFIFSGNIARIPAVNTWLRKVLQGREFAVALASSQVISNVPAALLLSGFTSQASAILMGVNIGGLGTPIASLASLISLKLYSRAEGSSSGRYLAVFTIANLAFMLFLTILYLLSA